MGRSDRRREQLRRERLAEHATPASIDVMAAGLLAVAGRSKPGSVDELAALCASDLSHLSADGRAMLLARVASIASLVLGEVGREEVVRGLVVGRGIASTGVGV